MAVSCRIVHVSDHDGVPEMSRSIGPSNSGGWANNVAGDPQYWPDVLDLHGLNLPVSDHAGCVVNPSFEAELDHATL